MKRIVLILSILLLVCGPVAAETTAATSVEEAAAEESAGGAVLDMKEYLFGHLGDSYGWHITTINGHHITIPLPCIVIDGGVHIFSSAALEHGEVYGGYRLAGPGEAHEGKIIRVSDGERPLDISITKNVAAMMFAAALLVVLVLLCARWYRRHDVLKEKPTGIAALLEPVIVMINDEVIKDAVGPEYRKFSPYLLTAFFFILINNLLGIVPIFPGGANVTGNIAVTFVMALCTFLAVNLFGNKHYYKDIFWPDVPIFLKAIPIMPIIEIMGMFTKPISLMIRLFANMLAGHIMLLSTVAVIFLTASIGVVLNSSMSVVSVLFGVFLDCLEVLVAFIQAYVFTMLSSVFIGLAHQDGHGN